jgi:CHASE3 domain sensor protein
MKSSLPHKTLIFLLAALLFAGALGWFIYYGPCGTARVNRAVTELSDLLTRWDDLNTNADGTSRGALASVLSQMDQVIAEVRALSMPMCLQSSRSALAEGMETNIAAYQAFLTGQSDDHIQALFSASDSATQAALAQIQIAARIAPFFLSSYPTPSATATP